MFNSSLKFQSARAVVPASDKIVVTLSLEVSQHKDTCLL